MQKTFTLLLVSLVSFSMHAQWNYSNSHIYNSNTGNVGIGTSSPSALLHVAGSAIFGNNSSNTSICLYGYNGSYSAIETNTGLSTNYNAITISNNTNSVGSLGSWTLDIGGSDRFTYNNYNTVSFRYGSSEMLRINQLGNVGLGTNDPQYKLTIGSSGDKIGFYSDATHYSSIEFYNGSTGGMYFGNATAAGGGYHFANAGTESFTITSAGNVGIGTTSPLEKLSINGTVAAKKLVIRQNNWSDYVFDKSYQLKSLSYVEQFIKHHKHLPDLPSADEIKSQGLSVGDNQSLLLQKIEELTLYIIAQEKRIRQLEKRLNF